MSVGENKIIFLRPSSFLGGKLESKRMSSWNSVPLEITYEVLGWIAFLSWSISFYPQVLLNFRRESSAVQQQYLQKYGLTEMIPVAANDVAFSIQAVLLTAFTLFQIFIYDRGNQRFTKISISIVSVVWFAAAVCVFVALPSHSWLWLISVFNTIQVMMTIIKYIPQAIMNYSRKSTEGFSIGNILLDFLGVTNYGQMAVQSIDQDSWVNFYGNIGKTLLSLVDGPINPFPSLYPFPLIFCLCSNIILYGSQRVVSIPAEDEDTSKETLMDKSSDKARWTHIF